MQLMQPNVQKWRTTTRPRRSLSSRGLVLIQSSASVISGAWTFRATGCRAGAAVTRAAASTGISIQLLMAWLRQGMAVHVSPAERYVMNQEHVRCAPPGAGHGQ